MNIINNNNNPIVISYENDLSNNINSQLFKKTLEKHKWDFKFIGENTKWEGFKTRINGYYNFLQTFPEDKIVILSDARDVFCLRDSQLFFEKIENIINDKIIISAECFLLGHLNWNEEEIKAAEAKDPNHFFQGVPLNSYWAYHNKTNNLPFRKYLNAGLIVGKAKNLLRAFKWIFDNNYNDDQLGLANYTNKYPELVHLDYEANILHTSTGFVCGGLYKYSIQNKDIPMFTELLGLSSYFLHIPGIIGSKGQKYIYNIIYNLLDNNIIDNDMFSMYNFDYKDSNGTFYKINNIPTISIDEEI